MLKRKCSSCAKKIEKGFNFCPYCGNSFKEQREEEDFGMIGRDDTLKEIRKEIRMPFGLDKIMGTLMKQLEKQFQEMENQGEMPRGFKIQVSTGKPTIIKSNNEKKPEIKIEPVSSQELERRKHLPKNEAESKIRRLADKIIYEIEVPGVSSKKDILITKLENSIEIKAYSKNKCYYKTIPLKVEVIGYYVKNQTLYLELKG